MEYVKNGLFAVRGVLTFVAFTEFITSARCLLPSIPEDQTYVQSKVFNLVDLHPDPVVERALCHVYGLYSLLNGLIILHLSVFIHYRPFIGLAIITLTLKLLFFLLQSLWFGTISGAPNLVFPIVTCFVSILATLAVPFLTQKPHIL